MRPKNEIHFSPNSYYFIRTMAKVYKSDISLTFTVAMVTKNGHQNRLKIGKDLGQSSIQSAQFLKACG